MVGYAAYADRFAGTLAGVAERASYLTDLGVGYLHLMPLLTPRPAPNDGGYAVQDFRTVRSDLGTVDDLRALTARLRGDGISLCLDLVLNHVAREHEWAVKARAGDATYRDYFLVYPDRTVPDAFERTLPEVFPDFAPGSFTWDDELAGWVWTTFNAYQWDVNWANPDVLCEYADVILDLANHGVEVFRLDAIAFTWKRLGTNCQNQPEVHALTQALRTVARIACPAVVFKAEAIVGPQDLPAYLGQGEHHGKVSDLAYHNGLMVQIWSMLASQDARLASPGPPAAAAGAVDHRLDHLRPLPRRHRLGDLRRGRRGRRAVRLRAPAVPVRLLRRRVPRLVGRRPGLPGEPRHRRPADLRVARLAGRARAPGTRAAVGRILLAHAVVLGFGGLPVIWMGDELGLLNDPDWDDRARARRGQPVGAPAADALAAAGRRARHPGRRPAPGPGPGRACRTCTPRSPPPCSTRATPGCCWSPAGTRSARCSGRTT